MFESRTISKEALDVFERYRMTLTPSDKYRCWLVYSQKDYTMSKVFTKFDTLNAAIDLCAALVERQAGAIDARDCFHAQQGLV